MRPADLHPIVLCHIDRFFGAARRVTERLDDDRMGSMIEFAGNMLWAHSGTSDAPPEQRRAMAVVGGAAGSFAEHLDLGGGQSRAIAAAALDDLERELLSAIDGLVDVLVGELHATGLEELPPSVVGAWVWQRLFPGYPWPCGQAELEGAIRARLG